MVVLCVFVSIVNSQVFVWLCVCVCVYDVSCVVRFGNEDKRVGTAESDLEQRLLGADLLVIS